MSTADSIGGNGNVLYVSVSCCTIYFNRDAVIANQFILFRIPERLSLYLLG